MNSPSTFKRALFTLYTTGIRITNAKNNIHITEMKMESTTSVFSPVI